MISRDKPKKIAGFEKYEVESAADTLIRAEEIRLQPKLFKAARGLVLRKRVATQMVKMKATQRASKLAGAGGD